MALYQSDFGHDVVPLFGAAPCLGEYVAYAQCRLAHDPCLSDGRCGIIFPAFEPCDLRRGTENDLQCVTPLFGMAREVEFGRGIAVAVVGYRPAVYADLVVGRRPSDPEQHLPVGPGERYGEIRRETVALLRPFGQAREIFVVAAVGLRSFPGGGVDEQFAAHRFAAVGRNILLCRQRAARKKCYDRKNTPHRVVFCEHSLTPGQTSCPCGPAYRKCSYICARKDSKFSGT